MASSPLTPSASGGAGLQRRGDSLADVLERVLDKGVVIAGDIRVDLLDIELLTIRIRLLVSSADKAEELGMSWWRSDPFFTGRPADGGSAANGSAGDDNGRTLDDRTAGVLDRLADSTDELLRRMAALEAGAAAEQPDSDDGA